MSDGSESSGNAQIESDLLNLLNASLMTAKNIKIHRALAGRPLCNDRIAAHFSRLVLCQGDEFFRDLLLTSSKDAYLVLNGCVGCAYSFTAFDIERLD